MMKKQFTLLLALYILPVVALSQSPALVGYWHNWNTPSAPYIMLDSVDSRYNVIDVAFAVPQLGTDYQMEFIPEQVTPAVFATQVQNLQNQGRKVIISMGGANAPVSLDNTMERDSFVSRKSQKRGNPQQGNARDHAHKFDFFLVVFPAFGNLPALSGFHQRAAKP